ncbi:MAG: glycoside hydrolase family 16 protein [bacterium]|nr:glycoside hydrolase family 16 protein [bacterium]
MRKNYVKKSQFFLIAFAVCSVLFVAWALVPFEVASVTEPAVATSTKPTSILNQILHPKRPSPSELADMQLVFNDEFDAFSRYVNAEGNVTCKNDGNGTWQTVFSFCSRTIASNYEQEVYIDQGFLDHLKKTIPNLSTESPFAVKNSIFTIITSTSSPEILKAVGPWAKYTSGLITTQFSFSQKYGYFEMRAKLPKGKGVWPAFWLLPTDKTWPPEVDILEAFGDPNDRREGGRTMIHNAFHSPKKSESCEEWHDVGVDITESFHTYGALVEPTGVTYYFDGKQYAFCPPDSLEDKPMYMLINVAVGGSKSWPTAPDASTVWPAYLFVDYVRAYSK